MHVQLDFRILRMEFAQQRRDPGNAQRIRHGKTQPATRAGLQLSYRAFGFFQFARDALAMFVVHRAGFGQADAARGSMQQARTQPGFQFLHLAADGGLGQAKRIGGRDEAALFDHLDEDQGVVEIVSHGMPSGGRRD